MEVDFQLQEHLRVGLLAIPFYGIGGVKTAATVWYQAKKKGDFD